jgi:CP family cyanate transporter-like MFS transporter
MRTVSTSPALPLWRGRALALTGIVLLALNLRTAVASLSPVLDEIGADVPLSSVGIGLLGTLPPISFAVFGLLAPAIARRIGLETALLAGVVAMAIGHLTRSLSTSYPMLLATSALALAGVGICNVLLPPAVKRYFPDRIGSLTAIVSALMAVSTAIPPLIAAPVSSTAGWRVALVLWGGLAIVAVWPWIALWRRERRAVAAGADETIAIDQPEALAGIWHSKIAWASAVVFAASSFNAYALFAWLPEILADRAGVGPFAGGALLSLYGLAGFPSGIIIPLLAVRLRNLGVLVYAGVAFFLIGYGGLLLAPATVTWLWVICAGLGPLLYPVALVVINVRTRTHRGSAALSGFTQGIGYSIGATGPFLVGLSHQLTGEWTVALLLLTLLGVVAIPAGMVLSRPRTMEDELARPLPAEGGAR